MRLIVLACATIFALSACVERQTPAAAPVAATPADEHPDTPTVPAPEDACGAAARQDWIGHARSSLPTAPPGADWRVFETGQPVIQDLRANRLNIEIDPARQTVVRISCG